MDTSPDLPRPLLDTDWLAAQLERDDIKLVDGTCFLPTDGRNAHEEFLSEHIPGAVFFDVDIISEPDTGLPHTWPSAERFADAVGELGISASDKVVCYEAGRMMGASRVWWMFRAFGHKQVAVLDGGLTAWKAANLPLAAGAPDTSVAHYQLASNTPITDYVCDWRQVLRAIESQSAQIIDARSAARFHGHAPEPRAGLRSGHMPNAINLPFDQLLTEQGQYKSTAELAQLFQEAGLQAQQPIITSCGSGVSAATLLLGLQLIGRDDAVLYDGSWSEWGSFDDTPIITLD